MRQFHFYDADTGILHSSCVSINAPDAERVAMLNSPPGHKPIEGVFDPQSQRVDIGAPPELVDAFNEYKQPIDKRIVHKVIDYVPPQPSADHEWSPVTKRWVLNAATVAKAQMRAAATARIALLEASQHHWIRRHVLGDRSALAHLQEIDDEVAVLTGEL